MAPAQARQELVTVQGEWRGIKVLSRQPPDGSPRAPLGVICIPGSPGVQLCGSQASTPFIKGMTKAMREARIPILMFDCEGAGESTPEMGPIDYIGKLAEDTQTMLELAKARVDKVVLCCLSRGPLPPQIESLGRNEYAYISLSSQESAESRSTIRCWAARGGAENGRKDASLDVASTKNGKGWESAVTEFFSAFVTELDDDLAAAAPAAAALESEPAPGFVSKASPVAQHVPQASFDYRVTCQKPPQGSVVGSFHVALPAGSTVGALRSALGKELPTEVQVCEPRGTALQDDDSLPVSVVVAKLECAISVEMVLTASQRKEAQEMMMETLRSPKMQKKLDELEAQADKNETKYAGLLAVMMEREVYPPVARRFGLPDGLEGIVILLRCIGKQGDSGALQRWAEIEKLKRTKTGSNHATRVAAAVGASSRRRAASQQRFIGG